MRKIQYQRAEKAAAQPKVDGWTSAEVPHTAGTTELRQAVVAHARIDDPELPPSATLHFRPAADSAYERLEPMQQFPDGQLYVIIAPTPGGTIILLFSSLSRTQC